MITDDRLLYDVLAIATALLLLSWFVVGLVRITVGRRPALRLGHVLAVAAVARVATAALFAAVPSLRPLRGPDETLWLHLSDRLTQDAGALGAIPDALGGNLHVVYMAIWQLAFDATSDFPLRVGHIALSLAAIAVIAVAVTDLAGVRAGLASGWILALEPNNVFFSGILHKEAPMLLGEAIVILGAVRMYQRRDVPALLLMLVGLSIAGMTRPYAGAALAVACMAVCAHAALRPLGRERARAPRLAVAVALAAGVALLAAPAPSAILDRLQSSQNANATDSSNLGLDPVDFSSVPTTIMNIGPRISALLLQPYPWQVANMSQRFGVVGTLVAWTLLLMTLVLVATRFPVARARLPPLLYVVVLLAIAYALSAGNAGTGFRYRTHLLVGITATMSTLVFVSRPEPLRYGSDE